MFFAWQATAYTFTDIIRESTTHEFLKRVSWNGRKIIRKKTFVKNSSAWTKFTCYALST